MNLQDATTRRQSELTQTLAGCATVNPALVVELTRTLRPDDLTDQAARKFLLALTPDSDPYQEALTLGLACEYLTWLTLACDELPHLDQAARAAADEIKRLTITRATLAGLSDWLAEAGQIGRYHV